MNSIRSCYIIFFVIHFFTYFSCEKHNNDIIKENTTVQKEIPQPELQSLQYSKIIQNLPLGIYEGTKDIITPNKKMVRIYNSEYMDTPWGIVYSPILYLYDENNYEIGKYTTNDLICEDFWPGNISFKYSNELNRLDMVFSLDVYGNYGSGFIDLNTNKYVRESSSIDISEEEKLKKEKQGIPDWEEGAGFIKDLD